MAAAKIESTNDHKLHLQQIQRSIADTERHISNLTDLRVRGLIEDDEFLTRRQTLQREMYRLQESERSQANLSDRFEPHKALLLFSNRAICWFDAADDDTKRKILEIVSSNPTLENKILNIQAKKPFTARANLPDCTRLRAERSGVRTFCHRGKKALLAEFQQHVSEYAVENSAKLAQAVGMIQELEAKFEGRALGDDTRPRRAA